MSIELFDGLVSPEIAGVLDEAMRAMPDSAVHVTPGRYGSGRVHVSIGGGSYDLSVTIDGGDTVASLELVHVRVGRPGNALDVLKAGLSVLAAADGIEQTDAETHGVWVLGDGSEMRWDKERGQLLIERADWSDSVSPLESGRKLDERTDWQGDKYHRVTAETTVGLYCFEFNAREEAEAFSVWLDERIREGRE